MLAPDFWQDKAYSKKILKEKKLFENIVNSYESSLTKLNDLNDLNQLFHLNQALYNQEKYGFFL